MKKKSYSASFENDLSLTGPKNDLVDSKETGARGFNLNEMTEDFENTDPAIYDRESFQNKGQVVSEEVLNLLVLMGDEMDLIKEESLANFADFLIIKFAQIDVEYPKLFNQMMIKINNSDLVNRNEIIKKLTNIYSKTLALEYLNTNDLEKARSSAYQKLLHRADQYLSED